jgi:uncharacterized protein YecA (UPF0149 family)
MAAAAAAGPVLGTAEDDDEPLPAVEQHRSEDEPGRNDPCWCGSGKKFKKCHGA